VKFFLTFLAKIGNSKMEFGWGVSLIAQVLPDEQIQGVGCQTGGQTKGNAQNRFV